MIGFGFERRRPQKPITDCPLSDRNPELMPIRLHEFDLNRPSAIRTHQAEWIKHFYQDYSVAYDRVVTDRREP
jgi:hypothetical protein